MKRVGNQSFSLLNRIFKKKRNVEIAASIWYVNIKEIASSWQVKLNRLNAEQNMIYSSKFEWEILRYIDFKNDFISFRYVHYLCHGTYQIGNPALAKHAATCLG